MHDRYPEVPSTAPRNDELEEKNCELMKAGGSRPRCTKSFREQGSRTGNVLALIHTITASLIPHCDPNLKVQRVILHWIELWVPSFYGEHWLRVGVSVEPHSFRQDHQSHFVT